MPRRSLDPAASEKYFQKLRREREREKANTVCYRLEKALLRANGILLCALVVPLGLLGAGIPLCIAKYDAINVLTAQRNSFVFTLETCTVTSSNVEYKGEYQYVPCQTAYRCIGMICYDTYLYENVSLSSGGKANNVLAYVPIKDPHDQSICRVCGDCGSAKRSPVVNTGGSFDCNVTFGRNAEENRSAVVVTDTNDVSLLTTMFECNNTPCAVTRDPDTFFFGESMLNLTGGYPPELHITFGGIALLFWIVVVVKAAKIGPCAEKKKKVKTELVYLKNITFDTNAWAHTFNTGDKFLEGSYILEVRRKVHKSGRPGEPLKTAKVEYKTPRVKTLLELERCLGENSSKMEVPRDYGEEFSVQPVVTIVEEMEDRDNTKLKLEFRVDGEAGGETPIRLFNYNVVLSVLVKRMEV